MLPFASEGDDRINPAMQRCRLVDSDVVRSIARLAHAGFGTPIKDRLPMLVDTWNVDVAALFDRHDGCGGNVIVKLDNNRVMKCMPIDHAATTTLADGALLSPALADVHGSILSHYLGAAKLVSIATPLRGFISIPPSPDSHDASWYAGLVMHANDASLAAVIRRAVHAQAYTTVQTLLLQITAGLGTMQAAANFVHNDLTVRNIMCQSVDRASVLAYRCQDDARYRLPTHGWIARIIDFSSCYMTVTTEDGGEDVAVVSSAAAADELLIAKSRPYVAWRDVMDLSASVMHELLRDMSVDHRMLASAYVRQDVSRAQVSRAMSPSAVRLFDMLVRWATATTPDGRHTCVFTQSAPSGGFETGRKIIDMMVSASVSRGILVNACTLAVREVVAHLTCDPYVGKSPKDTLIDDWVDYKARPDQDQSQSDVECPLPLLFPNAGKSVFPIPIIAPDEQHSMSADIFLRLRRASDRQST